MNGVEKLQIRLGQKYKYKALPPNQSKMFREVFRDTIPKFLNINGSIESIYNQSHALIAQGYNRIVIGDYGAFVEFSPEQANNKNYIIKPGQEYRLTQRYINTIKYLWYTTNDFSDTKIYYQQKKVTYADYQPGQYYVSVFEVFPHNK